MGHLGKLGLCILTLGFPRPQLWGLLLGEVFKVSSLLLREVPGKDLSHMLERIVGEDCLAQRVSTDHTQYKCSYPLALAREQLHLGL